MRSELWYVYILYSESGNRYYTGIALDVHKRLLEHNAGKGAKATRPKAWRPWTICHVEHALGRSAATKRELQIKKMSQQEKWDLMDNDGCSYTPTGPGD